MKVFIGSSPNHEDAELEACLEYSLRKHASEPVEITWMRLTRGDRYFDGWETEYWATPFTAFRWIVPELCGYRGRALYVDVDFIFLADVAELMAQLIPDGKIGLTRASRTCITVWDCESARRYVRPADRLKKELQAHDNLRNRMRPLFAPFEGAWNCLDGEDRALSDVKALHMTAMRHQPHLAMARERLARVGRKHWFDGEPATHWRPDVIELFQRTLREAEAAGYPVSRYTQHEIYGPYKKRSLQKLGAPSWAGAAPC